jgi:hypothetical protein
MPFKLPAGVTEIHSRAELLAYLSANQSGWALGIRAWWRITPIGVFPQVPGGGTKCYVVPNGKARSLDALVEVLLASPKAKNKRGHYRLFGHREILPEVIGAAGRAGYTVYGMPLTTDNKPIIPAPSFRELHAKGLEAVYALRRPGCKFYCYFGRSKDGKRRGIEHWHFGLVEMEIIKGVPAAEVHAAEMACIAEYVRLKRPLYNSESPLWPKTPLIGSLLPNTVPID